ncbi:MAG: DEAD/DEAH box helicase [Thermoanaerobaculia bacterium]|nr:DEAD/DEAH box helicase [Thermoanaerobaculia bacterium]
MIELPVDGHISGIRALLDEARYLVVTAPPGAGKTTRVPPALAEDGRTIVLQPRRVAARSLVRRIAAERGWTIGREVGWQIRFERNFSAGTRLLVATEGILTARLQSDPLLSDFDTVVLDEFHERSIHADLALALAKQASLARDDLRIVVMSATLDARSVSRYLFDCPIVDVPGRLFPIDVEYAPGAGVAEAAHRAEREGAGHLLCFLPGAREIREAADELRARGSRFDVHELHGALDVDAQEAAMAPSGTRKAILATNIAETSLTVEGVTTVIDSGLHRLLRYDDASGIDHLVTERISRDSAEQRAGRAGRVAPGRAIRLWDSRDILSPHREPEIARIDLASTLLDIIAWGDDPREFDWFESPSSARIDSALRLLERLGAIETGKLTPVGKLLQRLPLHPRLGRILVESGASDEAARGCVILSEGAKWASPGDMSTDSDLQSLVDRFASAPPALRRVAQEIGSIARREIGERGAVPLRRALLAGFPDRVAMRREAGSPRLLLASGGGASLARESRATGGEFLLALDVGGADHGAGGQALVRMASVVEREWLVPTRIELRHRYDARTRRVKAASVKWYDELVLSQTDAKVDPELAGAVLAQALIDERPDDAAQELFRRLRFAGIEIDWRAAVRRACEGQVSAPRLDADALVPWDMRREVERLAPVDLAVPSGRRVRLEYREDGQVLASVKLQELFGLAETPRLGASRIPVTFALLSPGGRPVQLTKDLRSFWENTYPEVRKELRGRYPKHPWPEDPWSAEPTARTKRR